MPLKLREIFELARVWCPRGARWLYLLEQPNSWGPAHELAHALLEPAWRRDLPNYGRCSAGFCACPDAECDVAECAAMIASKALVTAAKRPELAEQEAEDTVDYDLIAIESNWRRARALLKRKKLWPVPRTRRTIERALRRTFAHAIRP